jgi:hypothetical protein
MALRIWNGSNGSWSTPGNWYPDGVPQPGDVVAITAGTVDANGVNTSKDVINVDAVRGDITTGLSIDNTSLGSGSTTYLNGTGNVAFLTLVNAVTDGIVIASNGPGEAVIPAGTQVVNRGWWGIASTLQSSLVVVARGQFINAGGIESGAHASFSLFMSQDQTNYGSFQVDPGGIMVFNSGSNTPSTFNTFTNAGNFVVNGGVMDFNANVEQTRTGVTTVTNYGVLSLAGKFDGGTIKINSGMLNFAPTQFTPGPTAASELTAPIQFTGKSGEIDLGEAVTAAYRPDHNDILVMAPWKGGKVQAADFHLLGSYTASDFTFGTNGQIYYHHS